MIDITPYSLGLEIEGDRFIPLIKGNSQIPLCTKRVFTTIAENQSSVEIHILQGEHERASANTSLGRFLLSGVHQARKGVPKIEVSFALDVDGILHVKAKDLDTGMAQSIILSSGVESASIEDSSSARIKHKNLLKSLTARVKSLALSLESRLEPQFYWEIKEIIKKSNLAAISGSREELTECRVALETILGELEVIGDMAEEAYG